LKIHIAAYICPRSFDAMVIHYCNQDSYILKTIYYSGNKNFHLYTSIDKEMYKHCKKRVKILANLGYSYLQVLLSLHSSMGTLYFLAIFFPMATL